MPIGNKRRGAKLAVARQPYFGKFSHFSDGSESMRRHLQPGAT